MAESVNVPPRRGRAWLVVAVFVLATAGILLWQIAARRGSPNEHRAEMYQRTLATVRDSCSPPKPSLDSYCRDQAGLLLEFPECDAECVALARAIRHEPGRCALGLGSRRRMPR